MANVALMAGLDGGKIASYVLGRFGPAASYGLRAGVLGYVAVRSGLPRWLRIASGVLAVQDALQLLTELNALRKQTEQDHTQESEVA